MKKINEIYERTSVRDFRNQEISKELLYHIIEAGTYAPSSGNMQPWEFIVIDDDQSKEMAVSSTFSGYYTKSASHQQWIRTAPIVLLICTNLKRTASRYGRLAEKWASIDTANAVQNILLTATANGLVGCWVGGIDEQQIKEYFNLPSYVNPIGLLPLGYPNKKTLPKHKMNPLWVTHKNKFNEQYFEGNDSLC